MNKCFLTVLLILLGSVLCLSMAAVIINNAYMLEEDITSEMYSAACSILVSNSGCNNYTMAKQLLDNICNISCTVDNCFIEDADLNMFSHYNSSMCRRSKSIINAVTGNSLRITMNLNAIILIITSCSIIGTISFIAYRIIHGFNKERSFTDTIGIRPCYDPL